MEYDVIRDSCYLCFSFPHSLIYSVQLILLFYTYYCWSTALCRTECTQRATDYNTECIFFDGMNLRNSIRIAHAIPECIRKVCQKRKAGRNVHRDRAWLRAWLTYGITSGMRAYSVCNPYSLVYSEILL